MKRIFRTVFPIFFPAYDMFYMYGSNHEDRLLNWQEFAFIQTFKHSVYQWLQSVSPNSQGSSMVHSIPCQHHDDMILLHHPVCVCARARSSKPTTLVNSSGYSTLPVAQLEQYLTHDTVHVTCHDFPFFSFHGSSCFSHISYLIFLGG